MGKPLAPSVARHCPQGWVDSMEEDLEEHRSGLTGQASAAQTYTMRDADTRWGVWRGQTSLGETRYLADTGFLRVSHLPTAS
jgi:hypothetical protein